LFTTPISYETGIILILNNIALFIIQLTIYNSVYFNDFDNQEKKSFLSFPFSLFCHTPMPGLAKLLVQKYVTKVAKLCEK